MSAQPQSALKKLSCLPLKSWNLFRKSFEVCERDKIDILKYMNYLLKLKVNSIISALPFKILWNPWNRENTAGLSGGLDGRTLDTIFFGHNFLPLFLVTTFYHFFWSQYFTVLFLVTIKDRKGTSDTNMSTACLLDTLWHFQYM